MPTAPYAKVLMSFNGGGPVTGFQTPRAFADTVQLTGESLSGWQQAYWEIFGYPPGWATPSGWTLQASGSITSTDFTPSLITLPTSSVGVFGAWGGRLIVNNGQKNGQAGHIDMRDETWGWEIPSPALGLTEYFSQEGTQRDAFRAWTKPWQDSMRRLESALGGATSNAIALKMGLYIP
jgi:hypothetical protein